MFAPAFLPEDALERADILRRAQVSKEKVAELIQRAVNEVQVPKTVPITKLSSIEEKSGRSNRARAMAAAYAEAKKKEADDARKKAAARGEDFVEEKAEVTR